MTDREPDPDATTELPPWAPDLWPKLLPPPTLISPAVDDELVITVRIRVAAPDVAEHLVQGLFSAVAKAVRPSYVGNDDADLAGIEIALPDFRPYGTSGGITHEFPPPAPSP
jgi:hypothetical protein